jgi:hypothetical protein
MVKVALASFLKWLCPMNAACCCECNRLSVACAVEAAAVGDD